MECECIYIKVDQGPVQVRTSYVWEVKLHHVLQGAVPDAQGQRVPSNLGGIKPGEKPDKAH
jgi:hypothetical protein